MLSQPNPEQICIRMYVSKIAGTPDAGMKLPSCMQCILQARVISTALIMRAVTHDGPTNWYSSDTKFVKAGQVMPGRCKRREQSVA